GRLGWVASRRICRRSSTWHGGRSNPWSTRFGITETRIFNSKYIPAKENIAFGSHAALAHQKREWRRNHRHDQGEQRHGKLSLKPHRRWTVSKQLCRRDLRRQQFW